MFYLYRPITTQSDALKMLLPTTFISYDAGKSLLKNVFLMNRKRLRKRLCDNVKYKTSRFETEINLCRNSDREN